MEPMNFPIDRANGQNGNSKEMRKPSYKRRITQKESKRRPLCIHVCRELPTQHDQVIDLVLANEDQENETYLGNRISLPVNAVTTKRLLVKPVVIGCCDLG